MSDLFDWKPPYPARPGFKEGTTSREAAAKIAPTARLLRDKVLAEFQKGPKTADEVAAALGESILSVRPRVSELVAEELIERTEERRKNDSGMSARVWQIKVAS